LATIYTVGHGARSVRELVSILQEASIHTLVDVRSFPSSKRHPQFSRQPLSAALESSGIAYDWQGGALGGFRKGGYVEHMAKESFADAATALTRRTGPVCIMCAESNPDECHRSHIADWLVARGHRVIHLLAQGRSREHALHPQEDLWRDV
jgi:uncharacterized protein (DUF488 family)